METPIIDDPEDGKQDAEQFRELLREAQQLGLHYTGHDSAELEMILTLARKERGVSHPVPCYGLSYEPTDRRCRICQLRGPCAELDKRPRVEVLDPNQLEAVPCESCGQGELRVELRAPESDLVRDYGCTSVGCVNTLGIQCGWSEQKRQAMPPSGIVFEPKPKEKLEGVIQPPEPEPETAVDEAPQPKTKRRPRLVIKDEEQINESLKKKVEAEVAARPKLRSIAGGKGKKVEKPTVKKAEPKKTEAKKPEAKKKSGKGKGVAFAYEGSTFDNLTKIATLVTQSRNWSGAKFFQVADLKTLKVGAKLSREWKGHVITVSVVEAEE